MCNEFDLANNVTTLPNLSWLRQAAEKDYSTFTEPFPDLRHPKYPAHTANRSAPWDHGPHHPPAARDIREGAASLESDQGRHSPGTGSGAQRGHDPHRPTAVPTPRSPLSKHAASKDKSTDDWDWHEKGPTPARQTQDRYNRNHGELPADLLATRPADFWTPKWFPLIGLGHQPAAFDESILYNPGSFKRWAEFQDCLVRRYQEPEPRSIAHGDYLNDALKQKSGKLIFFGRYSKWDHTRDFWAPIGMVDKILSHYTSRQFYCNRRDLLNWMRDHPQYRKARPPPGSTQKGDYEPTGEKCFQLLQITLHEGEKGYFYRPNFDAASWQRFLKEPIPDNERRRNYQSGHQRTSEW